MGKIGKTLKNLLYAVPIALATTFLPGCEPDPAIKDTTPPKISIYSPVKGQEYSTNTVPLSYAVIEDNFKSAWYSLNNGAKVSLAKSETKNLENLANGNHKIVIGAEDLYKNSSKDSVNFTVEKSLLPRDTTPPKINISSPLKQKVYEENTVPLEWNIEEDNFKGAWYSLDNGAKVSLAQSGTKNLENLANGSYKIVLGAEDLSSNSSKDSVSFSVDKHTWKYLVNPFVQPNDTTKPIIWNNFTTTSQRNAHFDDRLYNYDKIDTLNIPGWVCTDYAEEFGTHFNGYPMEGLQNNGWHNIPVYTVTLMKPSPFHQIDAVMIGDYVENINYWRFIEPRTDSTYSLNLFDLARVWKIVLNYTRVTDNKIGLEEVPMFEFVPDGNGGWNDSGFRNPEIKLIEEREK